MAYTLSYVNMPNTEDYLDKEFRSYDDLMDYVRENYPVWTSYQIIVSNDNHKAETG